MTITPGQTHLIILLVSIAAVYYFYPEYLGIIAPLFVAITLYFSTNDMIVSMFSIIPASTSMITDFIIKYKLYIIIALALISAYYTSLLFQKEKKYRHDTDIETDSDIFKPLPSSEPSTDILKTSEPDDFDMPTPVKSRSLNKQKSISKRNEDFLEEF